MDQALKARLIGAVILVGLAVLVIPELLSGRKSAPPTPATASPDTAETSPTSRTITIELGAQDGGQHANSALDASTQTPAPASVKPARADESQQPGAGSPTAGTNVGVAGDSSAKAAAQRATVKPAAGSVAVTPAVSTPEETAPAKPAGSSAQKSAAGSGRTWSVQVGAFGSSTAAQKLATDLDGAGFAAYVAPTRQGSKALHRVRVGPVPDRSEADRLAARLKSRGLPVTVVAND